MCFQQFRPTTQAPQGQQFIPPQSTPQFHPSQNMGMPPGQGQLPPFSQPMPQFLSRPLQPGHGAPSTYSQPSMPMTSSITQPQSNAPAQGVPYPSSYTVRYANLFFTLSQECYFGSILLFCSIQYAPSPFGMPQTGISMPPQFQPSSQMSTPGGQQWMHSSQGTPVVAPLQQGSLQSFPTTATVPVSVLVPFLFHIKPF